MIFVKAQDRPRRSDCQRAAIGWTFAFRRPARAPSGPFQPDDSPPRGQKFYRSLMRRARIPSRTFMRSRRTLKRARAECAAWVDGKTTNIINRSPTPAQAPFEEGRSSPEGPGRPGFSASARIPAPREKFPARSLLGAKKFPASPLREFCRKNLKSKGFSDADSPAKRRVPREFAARREFSPYAASKSRCAEASSTDRIWAPRARVRHPPCRLL